MILKTKIKKIYKIFKIGNEGSTKQKHKCVKNQLELPQMILFKKIILKMQEIKFKILKINFQKRR